jgi:hypothetical protein
MATSTMQNSTESVRGSAPKKIATKRKVQARGSIKRKGKASEGLTMQLYRQGRDGVSSAYDSAAKASARAGSAMPKLRGNLHLLSRSQSVYAMMEERPLVMGAVGLGVGMVLAALLPSMGSHRDH